MIFREFAGGTRTEVQTKSPPPKRRARDMESTELLGLPGLNTAGHTRVLEPNGNGRGVADEPALHREVQGAIGLHVLVDLHVGGVPDVVAAAHALAEGFDAVPVVVGVELVGVSPDIEQPGGIPPVGLTVYERLGQIEETLIVVVAGGGHTEPVGGDGEVARGHGGAGVGDVVVAEDLHGHVAEGAHGVGAPTNQAVEELLQRLAVLGHLVIGDGAGNTVQEGVGVAVDGDLVVTAQLAAVALQGLLVAHAAVDGPLGPGVLGGLQGLAVEVEGALETVLVEDLHEADILLHAVVVGEGEGLALGIGEKHVHHHGLCLLLKSYGNFGCYNINSIRISLT